MLSGRIGQQENGRWAPPATKKSQRRSAAQGKTPDPSSSDETKEQPSEEK